MGFPALSPHHLAAPDLWRAEPVRRLGAAVSLMGLTYARPAGWRPLRLDLHLPPERTDPVPVVVYAHGGSFVGGVKEMGPWASLPARGIAVASIEYRLAGEASYPEPIEDVLAAIRWVRARAGEFGLDADRIAGWGSSAGGYLMTRAALADDEPVGRPVGEHQDTSARLSALALHYPVIDFGHLLEDALDPTPASQEAVIDVVSVFLGRPMAEAAGTVAAASCSRAAERARHLPPLHVSHGDDDHRCGLAQSRRLHAAWTARDRPATLRVIPGADHADPVFATDAVVSEAVAFLNRTWHEPGQGSP